MLPPNVLIKPWLEQWLREDIGRGDWAVQGLGALAAQNGQAQWVAKSAGVVCGLPVAQQVFELLDPSVEWTLLVSDGEQVAAGQPLVKLKGPLGVLLTGERVALNLVMRLSGVATATRQYVDAIATFPSQFVDTRKTTPGLRILEKYATHTGGARNHRMGLDDSVMVKDNHIAAAGGIEAAIEQIRQRMPYPLMLEVETESMAQVKTAIAAGADIIMLDNMSPEQMSEAVSLIRQTAAHIKIEASGNISLETIKTVAATGVDYISSSGPITRAPWLDISMRIA
ncbi:MAG: carboxylating nicotinate-nucleotide diphosphorylase [Cyanobacteria bacterium P01_B01_bin.77]